MTFSFFSNMLISTLISFFWKIDYLQLYEPTREFLVELQKSTYATMMAMSFSHFLSCLSEVLSFFICIFLLRHWLQFDLFRDSLWGNFGYRISRTKFTYYIFTLKVDLEILNTWFQDNSIESDSTFPIKACTKYKETIPIVTILFYWDFTF